MDLKDIHNLKVNRIFSISSLETASQVTLENH